MFLDLAEILADSVADSKMSSITWIIIVLIIISILVTVSEVLLRFAILEKEKSRRDAGPGGGGVLQIKGTDFEQRNNLTLEELRAWSWELTEREKAAVCGAQYIGTTFAGV